MRKSFSALVAAIAGMALLTTSVFAVDPDMNLLEKVQTTGKVVVSTDNNYPPYSQLQEDGTYEGFDIDVATEIAERLGVEVEFLPQPWSVITAGGWDGEWDISVGQMTIIPTRRMVLDFSQPYTYDWYVAANGHLRLGRQAVAADGSGPDPREFLRRLNGIIRDMHADGTLSDLSWQWLGADYTVVTPPPRPGK